MSLKKKLLTALFCIGLFLYSMYLWQVVGERYTSNKMPQSFEVMSNLEKNGVFALKDVYLEGLDGSRTAFSSLPKGKVYILSFWASWCEPCAEEFPSMIDLVEQFPEGVVILAVSHDSEKADLESFAKAFDLSSTPQIQIYWDKNKELSQVFAVDRLPESFVFDLEGKLARKVVGSRDWSTPDAKDFFEGLLRSK